MIRRTRQLILVIAGLLMSGCVAHTWAPGPGLSAAEFESAKARCSLMARNGGSDFFAVGSQSYVAGAALGHAIGDSVRANQNFNDCMVASGWQIADGKTHADPSIMIAQIAAAKNQRMACISRVRANPKYASLARHLSDVGSGKFTMSQRADDSLATPSEKRTLAAYLDEASPCVAEPITAISQALPEVRLILQQVRTSAESVWVLVIEGRLTWGEAAQRQVELSELAAARLRLL